MAAPQVAGTPAPAASPPASGPVSAADNGLDAILGDLLTESEPETQGEPEEAPEGQPGGTEEETKPPHEVRDDAEKSTSAPVSLDELLTDEALSTPDGMRKGAARLRETAEQQRKAYLQLKGYEKNVVARRDKLNHKIATFRSEKQTHQLLIDNVRSNLQGLHSNDPEVILTALGNLTGTDGVRAYELLTSRIVNRGEAKLDPQVKARFDAQERELQQLRAERAQEREHAQLAQENAQLQTHYQRIGEMVRGSTTTPHLTRIYNENPKKLTAAIVRAIEEDNGATPAPALFAQMEAELQQHFNAAPPQGTNGGTVQQPQRAQRSPGQSIGPRTAAAATPREPTEEEALQELSRDPEFMRSLGLA